MRVWTILTGVVVLSWAGLGWAGWAGLRRTRDNGQGGHQMSSRLGWAGLGWAGLGWAGGDSYPGGGMGRRGEDRHVSYV